MLEMSEGHYDNEEKKWKSFFLKQKNKQRKKPIGYR